MANAVDQSRFRSIHPNVLIPGHQYLLIQGLRLVKVFFFAQAVIDKTSLGILDFISNRLATTDTQGNQSSLAISIL